MNVLFNSLKESQAQSIKHFSVSISYRVCSDIWIYRYVDMDIDI